MKGLKFTVLLMGLFGLWQGAMAQEGSILLEVRAIRLKGTTSKSNENNAEYTFVFDLPRTGRCFGESARRLDWHHPGDNLIVTGYRQPFSDGLRIRFDAWEDDVGSRCQHTASDDDRRTHDFDISLTGYAPGRPHRLHLYLGPNYTAPDGNGGGDYVAEIEFSYTVPVPSVPTPNKSGFYCEGEDLTLSTTVPGPIPSDTRFHWEYHIIGDNNVRRLSNPAYCGDDFGNDLADCRNILCDVLATDCSCCDEPPYLLISEPNWGDLGSSTGTGRTVRLSDDIPGLAERLKGSNRQVRFRVRASSGASTSEPSAESAAIDVSALPPTFTGTSRTRSCSNAATGTVTVEGIDHAFPTFRYYIYDRAIFEGCTHPLDGDCIRAAVANGESAGGSVTVGDLGPGTYTMTIANPGDNSGNCHSSFGFDIGTHPDLAMGEPTVSRGISCPGAADGQVTVSTTGGTGGPLEFRIIPEPAGYRLVRNVYFVATFTGLPAGDYTITAKGGCGRTVEKQIAPAEPSRVTGQVVGLSPPDCSDPANGRALLRAGMGSGRYDFLLARNGSPLIGKNGTEDPDWEVTGLEAGDYVLSIRDAERPGCEGFEQSFSFPSPRALDLTLRERSDIDCHGGSGRIVLDATGGSGRYEFILEDITGGTVRTSADGVFGGLEKGNYRARVRNDGACRDEKVLPGTLTISEPPPYRVSLSSKNITCQGEDNGEVSVNVSGANGGYTYQWQFDTGSGWADHNRNGEGRGEKIRELFGASYRVSIMDAKGCAHTSEAVNISEPARLFISSLESNDITCSGEEDGNINITASGGWGNYSYEYSTDNRANFKRFDQSTDFGPGTYRVRVRDSEGCEVYHPEPIVFTAPGEALKVELELSDYNGFQVSCAGGGDGSILVNASGGNGGPFDGAGYLFSVDGGVFNAENPITGIGAGTHQVEVRDGRGCTRSLTLDFIAPTVFGIGLVGKVDVECSGDFSGRLEVRADGGVTPYGFAIDDGEYGTEPIFEGLTAGTYTVYAKDGNGCTSSLEVTINSLNPEIGISFNTTEASCFGYADGGVMTTLSGGTPPFTYSWKDREDMNGNLSGIGSGWYHLTVTDRKGCRAIDSIFVGQPENIDIGGDVTLCREQSHTLSAPPEDPGTQYSWSSDNGFGSTDRSVILERPGTYQLTVSRPDGCVMKDEMYLNFNDVLLEAYFLGATANIIGDTLQLVEVSYPKPDSVQWDFGPGALVHDMDAAYPRVSFRGAGDHTIALTAFLRGCVETMEKTVSFYAPEDFPAPDRGPELGEVGIKDIRLYPNPNSGQFSLEVEMHQVQSLATFIYNVNGIEVARQSGTDALSYLMSFDLSGETSGAYVMKLLTEFDRRELRIVIE